MAFSSLITAFGTLLGYFTEQRGPTVTSCLGLLICHLFMGNAMLFELLLGLSKKGAGVSTHIHCLVCSAHPAHPLQSWPVLHLSTLQLQWKTGAGLREDHESAGGREHPQFPCA